MSGFLDDSPFGRKTHAFIQWKGTDLSSDFYCDCGAQGWLSGYYVYFVRCENCGQVYEMPAHVFPRKVSEPLAAHGAAIHNTPTDIYWIEQEGDGPEAQLHLT